MIIRVLALVSLIKLSVAEDRPLLCASMYAIVTFLVGLFSVLAGSAPITALLLTTLILCGLSFVYFWILSKVEGFFWWLVVVIGVPIVFV